MSIQSYGSMMEQIGAARQRWLDQASASGASSFGAFNTALQSQQGGTTGSASSAGPANATAASTTTAAAPGQLPQDVNQAEPHRHHHHGGGGGGGMGSMFGGESLGALLGGQESTSSGTAEAGQSGLFASINTAVKQAISSYFSSQNATASTSTLANALAA